MISPITRQNSMRTTLKPDSILHIYYFEGTIPKSHRIACSTFIGNWEEDGFSFLFFLQPEQQEIDILLARFPQLTLVDTYTMSYEEWQGGSIEPIQIGRFLLTPPWLPQEVKDEEIAITLDSGVVFGNGTHPTTRDCLEAIEIACMGQKVQTMLDLGTGTGVLALGAAKLGCKKILAVDFNHLAAITAHGNVALNDLSDQILVVSGKAEQLLSRPTDLLVANIHYAVMKELVRNDSFYKQKWFILSGLLNSEAQKITGFLRNQPVHLLKHWHRDGVWNTYLGITEVS